MLLRHARLKAGHTQDTLARLSGVTQSIISRLERFGSSTISAKTQGQLEQALGLPPGGLVVSQRATLEAWVAEDKEAAV